MADPSGVWCVQLQGGGGRQRGALATDDNAADVRARPRDPGKIQTTPPRAHAPHTVRRRERGARRTRRTDEPRRRVSGASGRFRVRLRAQFEPDRLAHRAGPYAPVVGE
ncbi:hypothetical protein B9W62_08115 [Streptomyces sp. CS113]|nr:hypothetical protein B9W62_08115 [Streptomyces sp. CS113]